jgi:chemotaxis protein histidine kinase CheA
MKTELEKIVSVSGKPGIYQLVSGGKQATIVESLVDGKRIPVYPTQKVSTLSDISMFTLEDDMPLRDILLNAKDVFKGGPAPDHKSDSKVIRDAMKKILPNYDDERVYDSDIRKLLQWYNILQSKDMLDIASTAELEAEYEASKAAQADKKAEETPAAKEEEAVEAKPKKAAAKKATKAAAEPAEGEEPAKKAAPKKAAVKKAATRKKKEE